MTTLSGCGWGGSVADPVCLPTVVDAFEEARQTEFQRAWTPVVYNARMEVGVTRLIRSPSDKIFPVFRKHYEEMCLRVLNGQALPHTCYARATTRPAPTGQPSAPMVVSTGPEIGRQFLKQMKQTLEDK